MPCLFFQNLPSDAKLDPEAGKRLYVEVAEAAGVGVDDVEVHLTNIRYIMLRPDGTLTPKHGVHVFIEWHQGRTVEQKSMVGNAIRKFLAAHGLEDGLDITFRDSQPGESFYFDGGMVEG